MTIVSEPNKKRKASSSEDVSKIDIPAALQAAGISDPVVAQKVLDSLSSITRDQSVRGTESNSATSSDDDKPFGVSPDISDNAMVVLEKR